MVIGGVRGAQERRTGEAGGRHLVDAPEAENVLVESNRIGEIANVKDSMIEPEDTHTVVNSSKLGIIL